jgi:hypothetical protein
MQPLVNAGDEIAAVPWRINRGVLVVMRACAGNVEVKGLPKRPNLLFQNRSAAAELLAEELQFYTAMNRAIAALRAETTPKAPSPEAVSTFLKPTHERYHD